MVKQSVLPMGKFFSRERFGTPQVIAGLLLLSFLGQGLWLLAHLPPAAIGMDELVRVQQGDDQWHGKGIAGTSQSGVNSMVGLNGSDNAHSPLWRLIEAAPIALFNPAPTSVAWVWLTRLPYLFFAVMLGASLWYVSRRLYGNAGGYIALTIYCFSPAVVRASVLWFSQPNLSGVWGTFGAVFTAIAVAHTLYAPREVVLWNWRRIVLLGVSLALAIGSQFALAVTIPVLLIFMLYLAPERKAAAVTILAAACSIALLLLFAAYFFHPTLFWNGLSHAKWADFSWHALAMRGTYLRMLLELIESWPMMVLAVPAALVVYAAWDRTRYFGNTAPLLVAALFLAPRIGSPHSSDSVFSLIAAIFLFVFVAGIAADLLETKYKELITAVIIGLLAANSIWSLSGLVRIGH